jgi:hypothetical protein
MVASSSVHALQSSLSQPVRIDLLQPPALHSQLFAMQQENLLNSISARAMFVYVSPSLNVYLACATRSLLEQP